EPFAAVHVHALLAHVGQERGQASPDEDEIVRSPGDVYVMLNNIPRHPDAQRFLHQIANRGSRAVPAAPARRTPSVRP
ncbi:MAG: hypothetical protein H7138_23380, partial [Myxococcales bacterium]|nr:hypothetical protein [Myxococcales bacterium]